MWDTAEAVLKGKFIVLSTHIKKGNSQINNSSFYVKKLEKEEEDKHKEERKTRAEIKTNMINVGPNI